MAEEDGEEEEDVEDEPRTFRLRLEVRDEELDEASPTATPDDGSAYVREMMSNTRDMALSLTHSLTLWKHCTVLLMRQWRMCRQRQREESGCGGGCGQCGLGGR